MKNASSPGAALRRRSPLAALIGMFGAFGLAAALALPLSAGAAPTELAKASKPAVQKPAKVIVYDEPSEIGPSMDLIVGKSTLLRLPSAVDRISVGNPTVADVTVISPRELYLLGKVFGSTNLILWRKGGSTTIIDIFVNPDSALLQERLRSLLPEEKGIKVSAASDSVVLSGTVSSALRASQAVEIAEAFVANLNRGLTMPIKAGDVAVAPGTQITMGQTKGGVGPARVVNMMRTAAPQQVMLEVTVAEVQKTLLDKLGTQFNTASNAGTTGSWTYRLLSGFLTNSAGVISVNNNPNFKSFTLDAAKKDGLIKILAEPNIVAISGQEASFLAGGKIFIPVASTPNALSGISTITLEEKEFGVGLKFTPTVLDGDRINLKVSPEVSELSQTGTPFTTVNNVTAILPSMTTRRAQTTVQLLDGQSLAIAGLIKSNVNETMNRFPVLGEIPILGALFRSSEFQNEQTELMFVITPRLVRPLAPNHALPTDSFVPPSRSEFFLGGKLEGAPADKPAADAAGAATVPSTPQPATVPSSKGGFEVK